MFNLIKSFVSRMIVRYNLSLNLSLILIFFVLSFNTIAQENVEDNQEKYLDSLREIVVSSTITGPKKIDALLGLGYATIGEEDGRALNYINEALNLSKKQNDSFNIIRSYNRLARLEIYYEDDNRAIAYADSALSYSNKNKLKHFAGIGFSYRLKGISYGYLQRNDLSLESFLKANSFLLKEEQGPEIKSYLAENYTDLASIYQSIENEQTALVCINKALQLAKDIDSYWEIGEAYDFLSSFYFEEKSYDLSRKYIDSAKVAYEKVDNIDGIHSLQKTNAAIHLKEKNFDKAIALYKQNLDVDRLDSLAYILTDDYIFLSKAYMEQEKIEMSKVYLDSASFQAEISENPVNLFDVASQKAKIFIKEGNSRNAISILKKVLSDPNINDYKESQKELYKQLYEVLEQNNNTIDAYTYLKKHSHLNDSLQDVIKQNKFNVLQSEFNYNELSSKLEARDAQLKVSETEQQRAQERTYFSVGLLLLLVAFFIYTLFRQKKLEKIKREGLIAKQEVLAVKQQALDNEVKFKNKQITDFAIHISEKNDLLENIKKKLKNVKAINETHKGIVNETIHYINSDIEHNKEKIQLYQQVDATNDSFRAKLDELYTNLNDKEKKVATMLRLGQTSKQIALQLGISAASVDNYRYNLRKKMEIPKGNSLKDFIKNL
ncbi:tetratricopeptide repeat protein [Patiriisocius marinus]|nr:LuxR C-terminal-related transcriptional regulator [Patiriisocius marinus]